MFNKENWKEPILKNDLKHVLIYGIVFSILAGILGGAFDFLFVYINVRLSISLIILSLIIGYMVHRSYSMFHILYPVLTIPFMILGLFISHFTMCVFINGIENFFKLFAVGDFYLDFIKSPVSELIIGIQYGIAKDIILGIVNILIYIIAFVACYFTAKGRGNK